MLAGLTLAALTALLSGCPKNPPPPPWTGCEFWSTEDQVFAALASLYYREYKASKSTPVPSGLEPLTPTLAAELIRCDPDMEVRRARTRRAAISLASSIALLKCRSHNPDVQEFLKALRILGVPLLLVEKLVPPGPCATITPAQFNTTAGALIDHTESLAALQRTCCPCTPDCKIGRWSGMTVANFKVNVNRNAPCIFQAIDPQCWDNVCPDNFASTFTMSTESPCPSTGPRCRSSLVCDPSLPAPTEMSLAPAPTTPWCGLLSETVRTAAYDISTRIETVLKVQTARGPNEKSLIMDYGLCESRSYSVCNPACLDTTSNKPCTRVCPPASTCAVVRDCGWAKVEETNNIGYAELNGHKQLLFNSSLPELNAWSPFAMKVMVTEVADATCRESHTCPGQPVGACTGTAAQMTEEQKSPEMRTPKNCICNLPADACTVVDSVIPNTQPALCPAIGGP